MEQPMMKGQTKHLTGKVRDMLLALPDTVLMQTLARWLNCVDGRLLDWSDASITGADVAEGGAAGNGCTALDGS
jgi:hypothetical protein